MSFSEKKLKEAKRLMEKLLDNSILNLQYTPNLSRIKTLMRDGTTLFIQYNDYDEYGYSIIFSNMELDRCRFDNYDDRWNVSTRPHHFHPRKSKKGVKSILTGIPTHDIPLLCKLYLSGDVFSPKYRF